MVTQQFKVGDKVRVIDEVYSVFRKGEILTVTRANYQESSGQDYIGVGDHRGWLAIRFEKIEDEKKYFAIYDGACALTFEEAVKIAQTTNNSENWVICEVIAKPVVTKTIEFKRV